MAVLNVGASSISLTNVVKINNNTNSPGFSTQSITFQYLNNSPAPVVLTAAQDVSDCLFAIPWLQSMLTLAFFPSTIE
jgi:hypothetical protein